jgi:hypothetical protein
METFRFPEANPDPDDKEERKSMLLGVDSNSLKYPPTISFGRTTLAVADNN